MSRIREEWDRRWPERDNDPVAAHPRAPIFLACSEIGATGSLSAGYCPAVIPHWSTNFIMAYSDGAVPHADRVANAKRLIRQAADEERYRAMLAVLSTSGKEALWQLIETWEAEG